MTQSNDQAVHQNDGVITTPSLRQLQSHFEAQRLAASQLIAQQNQLLSSLFSGARNGASSVTVPPVSPIGHSQTGIDLTPAPALTKGKVVSLVDYIDKTFAISRTDQMFNVFEEDDSEALSKWGEKVASLLKTYGADDALAVNRKQMANSIFLNTDLDGLFYFKNQFGVLFAVCYVGADENYSKTLGELKEYASQEQLLINMMAHENRIEDLKQNGFTTTPMGIWQKIEPIAEFTLAGSSMRRLRYLVNKYIKMGNCKTIEYMPGTDDKKDEAICKVIHQWCELKETEPNFIPEVKQRIKSGDFSHDHRFFLTYRDDDIDNVMVFSRDNMNNGYLMDLEFYAKGLPLGSTEFALSEIIKCFNDEGRHVASLGLTMGTGLFEHENGCADVHNLFESLRKADYLNGDANAQYKNKYRPVTTTMYLARPEGCGKSKLNDLMMLLGTG